MNETVDVLVVGGGPAGLAAARELRRRGIARVVVIDREPELGGVPRHCRHGGFGLRDMKRPLGGPAYARRAVRLAQNAGVTCYTETTALRWEGPTSLRVTSPEGLRVIEAKAVLLATGCRERPRAARLVPGSRPAGVLTTGALQRVKISGRRAVVIGAEHVSFSAVHTLRSAGVEVLCVVTEHPRHQTYALFRWIAAGFRRIPVLTRTTVANIVGKTRVEMVELEDSEGRRRSIACDTVVFTGDWIPDNELARLGDIALDPGTRGPRVDLAAQTSRPGVFAAGNLLHGAETADVAALEGRRAAGGIVRYLADRVWATAPLAVDVRPPLLWIAPSAFVPGDPTGAPCFRLRTDRVLGRSALEIRQGNRLLAEKTFSRLVPNRAYTLSAEWIDRAIAGQGPVVVCLTEYGPR